MLTCCHTLLLCPGIKATFKFSVSLSDQVTLGESLDPSPGQRSLLFNGQAGRTSPGVCELWGGQCGHTSLVIKEHSSVLCDDHTSCLAPSPAGL